MFYYALGNLPASGTSTTFSSRMISSPADTLNGGELVVPGVAPQNPIFDWSLPNTLNTTVAPTGFGNVRAMTAQELVAAQTATTTAQNQYQKDVAALKTAYTFMNGGGVPTLAQVGQYLPAFLRVFNVVPGQDLPS